MTKCARQLQTWSQPRRPGRVALSDPCFRGLVEVPKTCTPSLYSDVISALNKAPWPCRGADPFAKLYHDAPLKLVQGGAAAAQLTQPSVRVVARSAPTHSDGTRQRDFQKHTPKAIEVL